MTSDEREAQKSRLIAQGQSRGENVGMSEAPPIRARPLPSQRRFTLRQLLLFIAGLAVLLAIGRGLWVAVLAARSEAERVSSSADLFKTIFALHELADQDPLLPYAVQRRDNSDPNSEALYSWRCFVPRNLGYQTMSHDLTSSWDAPTNAAMRAVRPHMFCADQTSASNGHTQFLAITGPGTAFGDGTSPPRALLSLPADTILIVETRNSGIHWTEPGDFDIRTMPRTIDSHDGTGISGHYPRGFHVAFADAEYWCLSNKFFSVEGAENNDREELLGPYRLQP
jgi:hypothetical protein